MYNIKTKQMINKDKQGFFVNKYKTLILINFCMWNKAKHVITSLYNTGHMEGRYGALSNNNRKTTNMVYLLGQMQKEKTSVCLFLSNLRLHSLGYWT